MTGGIFEHASMVSTVVRVRDVAASVPWYREKLGLEPVHVGADGPDHPIAVYRIAGSVVSLWQLPANQARVRDDNDRNTYVVVVMNGDLDPARHALIERGSTSARSAAARTTSTSGFTILTATGSN